MLTASVVICTFNRPALLREAVRTARAQALPPGVSAEVIVVDNSPDGNAAEGVAALVGEPGLPLRYLGVPEPNISLARNRGVAAGAAPYVVFLDDDEWCAPGWLAALVATVEATGADVVFGQVLAEFPDGPPDWDPSGRAYSRRLERPTGSPMGIRPDGKVEGRWVGTGNSLIRRATCLSAPEPFDPRLGRTGGEDFDLFLRLHAAGRRMVWCGEATVHEVVPGDRAGFGYFLRRSRRGGQIYASITINRAARPWVKALEIGARAAVQLPLAGLRWAVARASGSPRVAERRLKVAQAMGKLVWWPRPGHHR